MLLETFWDTRYRASIQGLRECTRSGYESAWRLHVRPALGGVDMDAIDAGMIESWLASIPTRGGARKAWGLLRAMLRRAVRWGLAAADVTGQVDGPAQPHYDPPVLDADRIRMLLRGFWGHDLEAWLVCSVTLGLRPEEAHGLEWSDIDLRSGRVRVERGVQWVAGREVTAPPKTELSRRTVVLPRFAVQRLRQIRGKGRLVGNLTPPQVDRAYRSWCKRHDLPFVPRRNLRHSWATTALAAGVDVAVVSRALGHSSIATTAKYYLRPDESVLRVAQRLWEKSIME